jgi:hypothetical protein
MAHAYFEIVFDDSGSMNGSLAGSTRLDVAKDLFEKDILPLIDSNTEVAVRLLRRECYGSSYYQNFGCDIDECLNFIERIEAIGDCTPLFNTMKDALKSTLDNAAHHKTIFVLTDGGDNCSKTISDVLTDEELKYFKQINVILAQFTVNSGSDVNQLSNFANTIGAKTFNFASGYGASITSIRTELKTALNVVGMNRNEPLKHCYKELLGKMVDWKYIESMGIQLHQAKLLHYEDFLSWEPKYNDLVSPVELAELKFLYGIRFKTGIGVEMMRTMLFQLVKPYYYNSNCIYWHFEEARWKYFPQPAPIVVERVVEKEVEKEVEKVVERIVEKEVIKEVPVEVIKEIYRKERYWKNGFYMVNVEADWYDKNQNDMPMKMKDPEYFKLNECDNDKSRVVLITEGDILKYVDKKPIGRPKKNHNS